MKKIYFCLNAEAMHCLGGGPVSCFYLSTKIAIDNGVNRILTSSLANLSFELMKKYEVYLCYGFKILKLEVGMELHDGFNLEEPTYYDDMDILDYFYHGHFNDLLGIKPV